jgi:hypothetical protein
VCEDRKLLCGKQVQTGLVRLGVVVRVKCVLSGGGGEKVNTGGRCAATVLFLAASFLSSTQAKRKETAKNKTIAPHLPPVFTFSPCPLTAHLTLTTMPVISLQYRLLLPAKTPHSDGLSQSVPAYHTSTFYPHTLCIHSPIKMEQTQCSEILAMNSFL